MANNKEENDKPEKEEQSVEKVPEPVRALFSSFFASRQPVFPPFMEKITEKHIDKVLDYSDKQDQRDFEEAQVQRKYDFWGKVLAVVAFVSVFVFLTIYVPNIDKELYIEILKIVGSFLGGLAAGYGWGSRKKRKED